MIAFDDDHRSTSRTAPAVREEARSARRSRFALGRLVATPGALALLEAKRVDAVRLLARHVSGDWGELDAEDSAANERAVTTGERILSSYRLGDGDRVWIISEADRSATIMCIQPASGSDVLR